MGGWVECRPLVDDDGGAYLQCQIQRLLEEGGMAVWREDGSRASFDWMRRLEVHVACILCRDAEIDRRLGD